TCIVVIRSELPDTIPVATHTVSTPNSWNECPFAAYEANIRGASGKSGVRWLPNTAETPTVTTFSDSGYGRGLITTPLTTLNMAVVAPIPRASVRITVRLKVGCRLTMRVAYRRSCQTSRSRRPAG